MDFVEKLFFHLACVEYTVYSNLFRRRSSLSKYLVSL